MKKGEQAADPIEKDFLDAIERIKSGKPKSATLKAKAKLGKLKLNTSSLAIEAGHSRTLIGHAGCQYPKIRGLLQASLGSPKNESNQEIKRLKSQVEELRKKLASALDQNAILLAAKIDRK